MTAKQEFRLGLGIAGFLVVLALWSFSIVLPRERVQGSTGNGPSGILLGSYSDNSTIFPNDVFVFDNYAYLVTDNNPSGPEFYIFDISNPASPVLKSSMNIGVAVNKIYVNRDFAFLATGDPHRELVVVNINNKTSPTQVSTFNAPGNLKGLSVYALGYRAYLGTSRSTTLGQDEFFILNVTNPMSISVLGSYNLDDAVKDIVVVREPFTETAYLATFRRGKEILSLNINKQQPSNITEVSAFRTPSDVSMNSIAYSFGTLYAVTNNNASNPDLFVFKTGATSTFSLVASLDLGFNNSDVEVYKDKVFVANQSGFSVLDIKDISHPSPAMSFLAGGKGLALKVARNTVFLASQNSDKKFQIVNPRIFSATLLLQDINGDGKIVIGILGDSNSGVNPYGTSTETGVGWPIALETLIGRQDVHVVSRAIGLATAVDYDKWFDAYDEIGSLMERNDRPDSVVLAFGTVDVIHAYPAETIISALAELKANLERQGILVYIALTPPRIIPLGTTDTLNPLIGSLDYLELYYFPTNFDIDFYTIMKPEDYLSDGLHINAAGQQKRAQAAYNKMVGAF